MGMKRRKSHKDVEFQIDQKTFKTFAEACEHAVILAVMGSNVTIDVIVWTASGARWWGGAEAVMQYRDDPEASVFERIVVKADSKGRVR